MPAQAKTKRKRIKSLIPHVSIGRAMKMGPIKFVENYLFPAMRREHGNGFAMSSWTMTTEFNDTMLGDGIYRPTPVCKTVSCIGGTMGMIIDTRDEDVMAQILGIPDAEPLFYGWARFRQPGADAWPQAYQEAYRFAETPIEKERIAEVVTLAAIESKGKCLLGK